MVYILIIGFVIWVLLFLAIFEVLRRPNLLDWVMANYKKMAAVLFGASVLGGMVMGYYYNLI